jgi:hypothetical protein
MFGILPGIAVMNSFLSLSMKRFDMCNFEISVE